MMDGIDDEGNTAASMGTMETEIASDDELNAAAVPHISTVTMTSENDQSSNRFGVVPGAEDFLCSGCYLRGSSFSRRRL